MNALSIITPIQKEEQELLFFLERVHATLSSRGIEYELILVADEPFNEEKIDISLLSTLFPVSLIKRKGRKGLGYSFQRGFMHAKYDTICTLPYDFQYEPMAIVEMMELSKRTDIVIAREKNKNKNFLKKVFPFLQKDLEFKVFKKEIVERLNLTSPLFDLEFIAKAHEAGYQVGYYSIQLSKKHATLAGQRSSVLSTVFEAIRLKLEKSEVIPFHPSVSREEGNGFHYKGKKFIHFSELPQDESAFYRVSPVQVGFIALIVLLLVCFFIIDWHRTLVGFVATAASLYFIDLFFNFYLIIRSFVSSHEIEISKEEIALVPVTQWPMYTILCPLYKEWMVIPQFIEAVEKIDYPKDKLQIMLLLEEDDTESLNFIDNYELPQGFETVIVPNSFPKTKPKACNYGLLQAKGEYIVIYDAEDKPEPSQLKKAILAFKKETANTVCIQAKLNFYNPHQNILTRAFTAEYSLWFDLVLTGLQSIKAPIPLGGTSNHFKTEILRELKGWDAFNVTEDADLGIRIAKNGYKTGIVASITLEEANSSLPNWFWQRTRWIKGYMQTYLLHMRRPSQFATTFTNPDLLSFQLVIGGKVLSMFINPFLWVLTILYFVFRSQLGTQIESLYPTPVFYISVTSLLIGNFLYMYYYMIGCARHGHFDLIKYVLFVPIYWLMMSAAAWVALYKLITAPHHWSKTKHGLHLDKASFGAQLMTKKTFSTPTSIPGLNNLMTTGI